MKITKIASNRSIGLSRFESFQKGYNTGGWYAFLSFVDIDLVTFSRNPGDYCFDSIVLWPMVMDHQPKYPISLFSVQSLLVELIRDECIRKSIAIELTLKPLV